LQEEATKKSSFCYLFTIVPVLITLSFLASVPAAFKERTRTSSKRRKEF
jgi:hypothetical protein